MNLYIACQDNDPLKASAMRKAFASASRLYQAVI